VKPRTWTVLIATALAAWVGLAGLLQQVGDAPVAEASAPTTYDRAATQADTPPTPSYTSTADLRDYLDTIAPHWRTLPDVPALQRILAADPLLVDVRDAAAYHAGHIPGAVNIPLSALAASLDRLPADRLIVITCASGLRAAYAAAALDMLGFADVYTFLPGVAGWVAAGEPLSTAAAPAPHQPDAPVVDAAVRANVEHFFAQLPADAYGVMQATTLEQLIVQRDALVVDVRDADAFATGRIPGSINIPLAQLGASLDRLPFDRPVVLSCGADASCGAAAPALHMLGYSNVHVFPPSFAGWQAANMVVER
jgi:rhodanese-related sulfurtransferase